ncbi:hypothetical protein RUM44_004716 [Polyplax serrata]|uniref:PHD-type domain-containing protein n=1 Tax=Polyplax serrata TaxID=468196 RepID=A0ABR1B430_POLSC
MGSKFRNFKKQKNNNKLHKQCVTLTSSDEDVQHVNNVSLNKRRSVSNNLKESPAKGTPKKMQTPKDILEKMKVTEEELQYRKKESTKLNNMQNESKMFKCTKCQFNFETLITEHSIVFTHPLMDVLMCSDCCEYYGNGDFSLDSDNEDKYCRWCGEGGTIFTCSKCICGFCSICVKKHFGKLELKRVQEEDDWLCYFCNPKPLWHLRFICSLAKKKCVEKIEKTSRTPSKNNLITICTNSKSKNESKQVESEGSSSSESEAFQSTEKEKQKAHRKSNKKKLMKRKRANLSDSLGSNHSSKQKPQSKKVKHNIDSDSDGFFAQKRTKGSPHLELLDEEIEESSKSKKAKTIEKLEELLKLSQYQMVFSSNWSKKKLTEIRKGLEGDGNIHVKKELEKIKWYFSTVASYFVGFSNSIDSLEKEYHCTEEKLEPEPDSAACSSSYAPVLKFLDFVVNQVNMFNEKGISLNDLMQCELYEDNKIIGLRKKNVEKNHDSSKSEPDGVNTNDKVPPETTSKEQEPSTTNLAETVEPKSTAEEKPSKETHDKQTTAENNKIDGKQINNSNANKSDSDSDEPTLRICLSELDESKDSSKAEEKEKEDFSQTPLRDEDIETIINILKEP